MNPHPASDCPSGKLGFHYRESEGLTASEIVRNSKENWRIHTAFVYSGHSGRFPSTFVFWVRKI